MFCAVFAHRGNGGFGLAAGGSYHPLKTFI
jgi:hypothetical protein